MGSRLKQKTSVVYIILLALSLFFFSNQTPEVKAYQVDTYFESSTSDGLILGAGYGASTYSSARTSEHGVVTDDYNYFQLGQVWTGSIFYIYRAYLFFDTSSIPEDATITGAALSLNLYQDFSTEDFNITVQNGQPTYPHDPMASGDYYYVHYAGDGGQMNSSVYGTGYKNLTLNSAGIGWIDLDGTTKLCLRSLNDINNQAPTTSEYLRINAKEKGSAASPRLYVTYIVGGGSYHIYGAYDEEGVRDGAINCSLYKENEPRYDFELDGFENVTTAEIPIALYFDIGDNESRVYYVYQNFEEIYVFKPDAGQGYYNYYFTMADLVGVSWGYLETLLNINGTDRVIERWDIKAVLEMPFTLTWGVAYKMRLVCSRGTYYYPEFVAGASFSHTFSITSDMFETDDTHTGDITATGERMNTTYIQVYYYDDTGTNTTNWVYVAIYAYGEENPTTSANVSSHTITYNWYAADSTIDYWALIMVSHSERGSMHWTFSCPADISSDNPFSALTFLGTFPFDPDQLVGIFILLFFFAVFSQTNIPVGIILSIIVACILVVIGFLDISWGWLTTSFVIGILISISIVKERKRTI